MTDADFRQHPTGRLFSDVVDATGAPMTALLDFFSRPDVRQRLLDSELHHDCAPLTGVVRELERLGPLEAYLAGQDAHHTQRFRQVVGVVVLIIMERMGWRKAGRKGSLGRRAKVAPGTTTPGVYCNATGIAQWFTQAERYEPKPEAPEYELWLSFQNRHSARP